MGEMGILVIHGMGNQPASFANGMRAEISGRLADPDRVRWKAVHWGGVLEGRENELFVRLNRDNTLDHTRIRGQIVISGFGDAIAYMGPPKQASAVYDAIHDKIAQGLTELADDLEGSGKPLVVMAHSLGCAMVSDYIWDAQHRRPRPAATGRFARAETLAGMITFGCNLPLFTLALPPARVEPIAFPGSRALACFRKKAAARRAMRWVNFYDPDDVLGYPLRPINDRYRRTVTEDRTIQTGTILGAHTGYWTDNSFTRPAARILEDLLAAL